MLSLAGVSHIIILLNEGKVLCQTLLKSLAGSVGLKEILLLSEFIRERPGATPGINLLLSLCVNFYLLLLKAFINRPGSSSMLGAWGRGKTRNYINHRPLGIGNQGIYNGDLRQTLRE